MNGTGGPALVDRAPGSRSRRVLFLAVCALGVSAFITQLTLIRELLSVFSGNELVLGIVLGSWLLLTGLGSYLGKSARHLRDPIGVFIGAQLAIALLPLVQVVLLRTQWNVVFLRGAAVGVTEAVAVCVVLLAPYCLLAGYLLTLSSLILAVRPEAGSIGQVYFLDNIGDMVGGLLFTFVLVIWFNHVQILYVPAALNLAMAGAAALVFRRRWLLTAAMAVLLVSAAVALKWDWNRRSAEAFYAGQEMVYLGNSPYGSLVVTKCADQVNFIENGVPLFSTGNVQQVEETIHYAMAQRPQAQRVLLISGGVSGTAKEILRYGVQAVDYVELDPLMVRVARQYVPHSLDDPRIHVVPSDGRLFLRQTDQRYGVIIVDLPDPVNSRLNRFYTREFFQQAASRLAPQGVLCISLGRYENYLSAELARLIAVTQRTLQAVFDHVLILPAGRVFYLASDGPLTADVVPRIEGRGLKTKLVNRYYVDRVLTADRLADVRRAASPTAPVNTDLNPVLYFYELVYWMTQFKVRFGILEGSLLLMFGVCLVRARPVTLAVFTTGMAASALEIVLLLGFQILCGSLYRQVGWIVTMFMIGLGLGSLTMNRQLARRHPRDLIWLQLGVAAYAALVPVILIALSRLEAVGVQMAVTRTAVPLLALVLAVFVGLVFPLAGKADFRTVADTAGRLYSADYLGAALGALLVSTWLIPVLGVVAVCLLTAGLNVVSAAVLFVGCRR